MNKGTQVSLPDNPEGIIQLAEKIINTHTREGAQSPLPVHQVANMSFKLKNAQNLHRQGILHQKLADEFFKERDRYIKQDNLEGKNSLKKIISNIYNFLSLTYKGKSRQLKKWGFGVKE